MKSKAELFKERRHWVNEEFGNQISGKHISMANRSKILKKLWREAKRKYK